MIYDCFTFFNELELLDLRLNILNDVVDKFILVEMNKTHMGEDKPFIFDDNKEKFSKFLDKIIYIKVDKYPELSNSKEDCDGNKWILENYQRDQIMQGLKDAKDDDIIIISDLDEIPNPDCIKKYTNGIQTFEQKNFYYYLNYLNVSDPILRWGTKICHFSDLKEPKIELPNNPRYSYSKYGMPTYLRCCIYDPSIKFIKNGGWHFSFVMDIDKMILKRQSIVEQQYNTEENMSYDYIKRMIEKGKDLFSRPYEYEAIKIDKSYPEYIRKNQDKYSKLIYNITPSYKIKKFLRHFVKDTKTFIKKIFSIKNTYSNNKKQKQIEIFGIKIKIKIKNPIYSVIIPTMYKDEDVFNNLLKELDKNPYVGEILIINNTVQKHNYSNKKIRIIHSGENIYVNPAWNLGIKESKYDLFAILNDDILLPENMFKQISKYIYKKNVGIFGIGTNSICTTNRNDFKTLPKNSKIKLKTINYNVYHWGCAIFGRKENYYQIPKDIKIFCGDNYLIYKNVKNNKKVYKIENAKIKHLESLTSASPEFDKIKENDIKLYSKIDSSFSIKPVEKRKFRLIETIFSIKNSDDKKHKILTILGIKLSFKR